ncbi:MAG: permease-like cell division protein FtsX [Clostridiaceae bacterium]|jgi:cell division transport system permease protein|nr:permease-like cell division protein FtsX [Butyricicoccus pullicaecorum]MBS7223846.1 permease-like cell division protein FtsX [Clostridiaceae bacterium]
MSKQTKTPKRRNSKTGLSYFWSEGVHNIFLNGFMSFAAVSIILACLLITGSVTLISYNIDLNIRHLQEDSEIMLFVDESFTSGEARALQSELEEIDNVKSAEFQSKEESLEDLRDQLGEDGGILEGYDSNNNFMRDGYRIKLNDISQAEQTEKQIAKIAGIAKVVVREDTLEMLVKARQVFRVVSVALIAALGAISIFIISNTVKLAMFARREEIAIEKMVGATNWFIRWPFIIEGMLLGLLAGILAALAEWGIYEKLASTVTGALSAFQMAEFQDFAVIMVAIYLGAGVIIGVGGSVLSMRRFLDV